MVYLEPSEFKSTWLGNKAVYRTRMAMANGANGQSMNDLKIGRPPGKRPPDDNDSVS